MPISFTCPSCGTNTQVDDSFAGRSGPCASCGATVTIPGPAAASPAAKKSGASTVLIILGACALLGLVCVGGLAALLIPAFSAANQAAERMQCTNNLKQIALAMHSYHDTWKTFPPAYIPDDDGTPMHSWRVLILPFMEDAYLYEQYDFNESWDSPNNFALTGYQPAYYTCPSDPTSSCSYFAISVPNSVLSGAKGSRMADIVDGTTNTLMIVEVAGSNVHWMEPTDLGPAALSAKINSAKNGTVISSNHPGGAAVALADGSVHFLSDTTTLNVLQLMTTMNDGQPVDIP